jgi:hypothetical protein
MNKSLYINEYKKKWDILIMSDMTILMIEKDGNMIEKKIKSVEKLYSICNYRNNNNFELLYTWRNESTYELYGKRKGKAVCENQVILPTPLNEEQFFGTLCILKRVNGQLANLTLNEWTNLKLDVVSEETVPPDEKELIKEEYEPEPEL